MLTRRVTQLMRNICRVYPSIVQLHTTAYRRHALREAMKFKICARDLGRCASAIAISRRNELATLTAIDSIASSILSFSLSLSRSHRDTAVAVK